MMIYDTARHSNCARGLEWGRANDSAWCVSTIAGDIERKWIKDRTEVMDSISIVGQLLDTLPIRRQFYPSTGLFEFSPLPPPIGFHNPHPVLLQ
jgi:hypothetical protein